MSDDKLQELIRSATVRPATPVDVESLWRRGQRRNRRRRAEVTGALATVLVVSVVATTAALGGGSDGQVRTGETASDDSVESPASQEQGPFEWGSHDHLSALADCVRSKGFDPIVDLEDGRIEVHVPPKDDPVPVCEQELEDRGVVESRGPSGGDPGAFDAEARRQEDEARRQAEAQQRRATNGQSRAGADDAASGATEGEGPVATQRAADGTVEGTLQLVGGRVGADPVPIAGTVEAQRLGSNETFTVETTSDGQFSFDLEPGEYQLVGRSPQYSAGGEACRAEQVVVVRPGEASTATVDCQMR